VQVIRHNTAVEFLARAKAWLERAEAEHNLILGIAGFFETYSGELKVSPYFLTVEDKETIVGAALMTPPRRLLLTRMPDLAVLALADYMLANGAPVPGVLGLKAGANRFAEYWTSKTGRSPRPKMSERIYKCRNVIPLTYSTGQLRTARKEDEALLSE
jgi:hypothetical protein